MSFEHVNRCEVCHKTPNRNPFQFMNKRTPCSPDDWMSLTTGHHCKCRACWVALGRGTLHNTPLQVRLLERGYEWQAAACEWPSACEWGDGGVRCITGMTSDECCTLLCALKQESDMIIIVKLFLAGQVRVCHNTTWQDMKCVRTAHKANVFSLSHALKASDS